MVLNGGDFSCGMKSFHDGIRSTSPEAETRSYWPPPPLRMSATISSEEPAYLAFTLQPVCCSNGLAQSGWAYPSHATRLSWPSPGPMLVGRLGLVAAPGLLLEEPPPQPLATSASTVPSASSPMERVNRAPCLVMLPPPGRRGRRRDPRSGTPAPAAMPAARDDLAPGGPPPRCRGSAAPPPAGPRPRGPRRSG